MKKGIKLSARVKIEDNKELRNYFWEEKMKKVWILPGALLLFVLAVLLDVVLQQIGSTQDGRLSYLLFIAELIAFLGFALLALLFVWQVLFIQPRSPIISGVLIFLGVIILASLTVQGYFFWTSLFAESSTLHAFYTNLVASQSGLSRFAAAILGATGVLTLLPATARAPKQGKNGR